MTELPWWCSGWESACSAGTHQVPSLGWEDSNVPRATKPDATTSEPELQSCRLQLPRPLAATAEARTPQSPRTPSRGATAEQVTLRMEGSPHPLRLERRLGAAKRTQGSHKWTNTQNKSLSGNFHLRMTDWMLIFTSISSLNQSNGKVIFKA